MKPVHELAKFFPAIEGDDFAALCADIEAHGLLNPIVTYEDKILDGSNRARACDKVGVKPRYEPFVNGKAFDYVVSQNIHRRHLTIGQLSALANEFAKRGAKILKGKEKTESASKIRHKGASFADTEAAAVFKIHPATLRRFRQLEKDAEKYGMPEYVTAVKSGEKTIDVALREMHTKKAEAIGKKAKAKATRKRLQDHSRQVADYTDAMKAYVKALKLAAESTERFSMEAVVFTTRKHDAIRKLMGDLEAALKERVKQ